MLMFGTPDFGRSDLWHLNFSLKFLLDQALHSGYFPVWSKDIGTGFPSLGEGQMGMFNPINIILFRLFDPVLAIDLGYLTIFSTTFLGSYLFGRVIKLSKLSSLFLATIFSLSGFFVTHVPHFNLIQTASFFPWLFYFLERYLQTKQIKNLLGVSIALALQIYSGFPQIAFISMFTLSVYFLIRIYKKRQVKELFFYTVAATLGILLAFPQIYASVQLIQQSFRTGIDAGEMARFPFSLQNLLTFLNPYLFGDPRIGTYPPFADNWGIFWESTGYIGIVPIVLFFASLFSRELRRKTRLFLTIAAISLILLLGRYTPVFAIYQIPPFSLFRVPARFLLPFIWSLAVIAAIFFNVIKNKLLITVVFFISITDILYFAKNYNAVIPNTSLWLEKPAVAKFLDRDKSWYRIYAVIPGQKWNQVFETNGWRDINKYYPFRNFLDADQNLIWDIPSADYYHSGLVTKRQQIWSDVLESGINNEGISSPSAKLLSLAGVKYFISPDQIKTQVPVFSIDTFPEVYVYKNQTVYPHAYTTNNLVLAEDTSDLVRKTSDIQSTKTVVEDQGILDKVTLDTDPIKEAEVVKNADLEVEIAVTVGQPSLLVLSDSDYPNWHAFIDSRETNIYPVNINERGVVVPPGQHLIKFRYQLFNF